MLAVSGGLDRTPGGPYVPTTRNSQGEVVVDSANPGAARRSIYMQQRRTQMLSFLGVFDSPSIVFNCVQRPVSTIPLQSLSLLNSQFAVTQAGLLTERLARESAGDAETRIRRAFVLAIAREPSAAELASAVAFVESQRASYAEVKDIDTTASEERVWRDFCQMLMASNLFLYVE
jgi:hypothetical protein